MRRRLLINETLTKVAMSKEALSLTDAASLLSAGLDAHYGYKTTGRPLGALAAVAGGYLGGRAGSALGSYVNMPALSPPKTPVGHELHGLYYAAPSLLGDFVGHNVGVNLGASLVKPTLKKRLNPANVAIGASALGAAGLLGMLAHHYNRRDDE